MNTTPQPATQQDPATVPAEPARPRRWRPSTLTTAIAFLALGGMAAGLYPMTAGWITSYNQSKVIVGFAAQLRTAEPSAAEQLLSAEAYNAALTSGVDLQAGANVPTGVGAAPNSPLDYDSLLQANTSGMMARVQIPAINVDLPVFHGTSDAALLAGAGHLMGSHLPVGGESTRSVITAHRGLASATMFTNLDRVAVDDRFTVETFGRVLTYRVRDISVIDPDDTESLRVEPGEDLVTLITCTPLGINTQRILVTGSRITPTPAADLAAAGASPTVPGIPWWAFLGSAGFALLACYVTRQGFTDARARSSASQLHRAR